MPSRFLWFVGLSVPVLATVVIAWGQSAPAQSKSPASEDPVEKSPTPAGRRVDVELRMFMRMKLDASSRILEGLAIEDLSLVREGARNLAEMSRAEKWRVSTDPLYRQHSADFQEIVAQLEKAAEEKNPDRAALKWMDATMSCLECHRYVRGMHLVSSGTP